MYQLKTKMTIKNDPNLIEKEEIFKKYSGLEIKEWGLKPKYVEKNEIEFFALNSGKVLELKNDFDLNNKKDAMLEFDTAIGVLYDGENYAGVLAHSHVKLETDVKNPGSCLLFKEIDFPEEFVPKVIILYFNKNNFDRKQLDDALEILNENMYLAKVKIGKTKKGDEKIEVEFAGRDHCPLEAQKVENYYSAWPHEIRKKMKEYFPELKLSLFGIVPEYTMDSKIELKKDIEKIEIKIYDHTIKDGGSNKWLRKLPISQGFWMIDTDYPKSTTNEIAFLTEDSEELKVKLALKKEENDEDVDLTLKEIAQKTEKYYYSLKNTAEKIEGKI